MLNAMTALSEEFLNDWRERLRQDMLAHPQHHLNWQLRREFYLELGNETPEARAFRGWLAILAVQKVLPALLDVLPSDTKIFDELSASIWMLKGEPSPHDFQWMLEQNYQTSVWDFVNEQGGLIENALAVSMASLKAMQEIKSWSLYFGSLNPFECAPSFSAGPDGRGGSFQGDRNHRDEDMESLTDEAWAHLAAIGDAASAAAVAAACTEDSTTCDPAKLMEFWDWWLDTGFQKASELATKYPDRRFIWRPPATLSTWPDVPTDVVTASEEEFTDSAYLCWRPEPFGDDEWPDEME